MCTSLLARQRGISLIELIMFIVIVSVGVAGILVVMNQVMRDSADPLLRKQALAIAESMLEEIQLQEVSGVSCTGTLGADANRTGAGNVCDYSNYHTTAGVRDFATNTVIPGLTGYNIANVAVTNISALPGGTFGGTPVPAGSGVQITVTVSDSSGGGVTATGYRAGQ
jgi:MSHA pilin protein MshD